MFCFVGKAGGNYVSRFTWLMGKDDVLSCMLMVIFPTGAYEIPGSLRIFPVRGRKSPWMHDNCNDSERKAHEFGVDPPVRF